MSDPKKPGSLEDLDAQLRAARDRQREAEGPEAPERQSGMGAAWQLAVEMVTALVISSVLGYGLDRWLGTRPWLLILFFLLGAGAGVMNAMRVARQIERAAEEADRRGAGKKPDRQP